jgi:hypothetical protein
LGGVVPVNGSGTSFVPGKLGEDTEPSCPQMPIDVVVVAGAAGACTTHAPLNGSLVNGTKLLVVKLALPAFHAVTITVGDKATGFGLVGSVRV